MEGLDDKFNLHVRLGTPGLFESEETALPDCCPRFRFYVMLVVLKVCITLKSFKPTVAFSRYLYKLSGILFPHVTK